MQNDVISRLLRDRILLLGSEVNDDVANNLISQMLYLNREDPNSDITLYINSPGGSVQAGLAIFDTMNFISCDVNTVCYGMAASMGAFLLASGTKGKRRSLPNSRIMIHQPLGGSQGEVSVFSNSNDFHCCYNNNRVIIVSLHYDYYYQLIYICTILFSYYFIVLTSMMTHFK